MTRYYVVAGLFVLSLITYIDRAAISSAKEAMAGDLAISDQAMGAVFSAFALGYAIAQIPAGWFADRAGPRLMLAAVVALWSALTALTGAVSSLASLLAVRFLFGVAEAGAFPGSARAFYNWLSSAERGRANGIVFAGSRLGAAGAFPVMAWILANGSWRSAFLLLAIPGMIWAVCWALLFRNEPSTPPLREESGATAAATFGEVFRSRPMLLAMAQYFGANFTTFLCLSWMHPYLKQRYALSPSDAAFYAMLPLLAGATTQWITGFVVDRLYRSAWRGWSRRLPAMAGFLLSAAAAVTIPFAPDVRTATLGFVVTAFGVEMTISPSWAFCMDVGGRNSGAVTGSMNMLGNLGSFVSANAFPYLQQVTGDVSAYFFAVAAMNVVSVFCWSGMRSGYQTAGQQR